MDNSSAGLELRDLSGDNGHTHLNNYSGIVESSSQRSILSQPTNDALAGSSTEEQGSRTERSTASVGSCIPKPWYRKVIDILLAELRSITHLQWVIMMVTGVIVLPWAYKSYRLALWTAELDYIRQCRATVVGIGDSR